MHNSIYAIHQTIRLIINVTDHIISLITTFDNSTRRANTEMVMVIYMVI